ncbi:rRNA maturation RNase YbeY [Rhodoblastus sp. 17X3]|uniref:rRNA maturation RNase YbeY n=1 Tax=Rhodoblastus sp. 17X3 TaxID=3047026 RepID=UPI0024B70E27|nr:rRNA maturation RNase YbeY [Rhodoblastus sp. 17X3]MDI9849867.1 rRNA maturation RNase YbeY [Rhodoblastus sp. 17X3]
MRLTIGAAVECPQWENLPNIDGLLAESLQAVLNETGEDVREGAEVSFLFCDDARIRELNRQFRGKDQPTNVLSFPGPDPLDKAQFLGDIALAFETIAREAQEQGKSLEHHCRHMIVHGFLHLLGYDHEESVEAEEMEATEIRILQALGVEDPYREDNQRETDVNGRA